MFTIHKQQVTVLQCRQVKGHQKLNLLPSVEISTP